jgi:hypothetical protein
METNPQVQFSITHTTTAKPTRRRGTPRITDFKVFDFHGTPITTFEADGKRWVVMRPIFAALGLSQGSGNRVLIQSPKNFMSQIYKVPNPDGTDHRPKLCLSLSKFKVWLKMLMVNKTGASANRDLIALFKLGAANALFDFWRRESVKSVAQPVAPPQSAAIVGAAKVVKRKPRPSQQAREASQRSIAAAAVSGDLFDGLFPPKSKDEIMGYIAKHITGPMKSLADDLDEKFTYIDERLKNSHARDAIIVRELRAIRELLTKILEGKPVEPLSPIVDPEWRAWYSMAA